LCSGIINLIKQRQCSHNISATANRLHKSTNTGHDDTTLANNQGGVESDDKSRQDAGQIHTHAHHNVRRSNGQSYSKLDSGHVEFEDERQRIIIVVASSSNCVPEHAVESSRHCFHFNDSSAAGSTKRPQERIQELPQVSALLSVHKSNVFNANFSHESSKDMKIGKSLSPIITNLPTAAACITPSAATPITTSTMNSAKSVEQSDPPTKLIKLINGNAILASMDKDNNKMIHSGLTLQQVGVVC
jgi:hypothetical protein